MAQQGVQNTVEPGLYGENIAEKFLKKLYTISGRANGCEVEVHVKKKGATA